MRRYVRDLGRIYESTPALYRLDNTWDGFQWLNVDDCDRSSVAFMRMSRGSYIVCALNFTPCAMTVLSSACPNPACCARCSTPTTPGMAAAGCSTRRKSARTSGPSSTTRIRPR